MESHTHQSSVDAAMPQGQPTGTENMTAQTPGTTQMPSQAAAPEIPGQASPTDAAQTVTATPLPQAAAPDQPNQSVFQSPQAQAAGQQVPSQPSVIVDQATGQLYYTMPQGQPVAQPAPNNGQYVYYTAQTQPEQLSEPRQPDFAQIIKSVEDFAEGDATVADVVKTLWTETSQDDQFWKGAVAGAVAAVLFTSESMRGALGKTFGGLSGKNAPDAEAPSSPESEVDPKTE